MGGLDFTCTAGWGISGPEREEEDGWGEQCWRGGCSGARPSPPSPVSGPGPEPPPDLQDDTGERGSGRLSWPTLGLAC